MRTTTPLLHSPASVRLVCPVIHYTLAVELPGGGGGVERYSNVLNEDCLSPSLRPPLALPCRCAALLARGGPLALDARTRGALYRTRSGRG